MVKQRRSFFVDDILHMVMPTAKDISCSNEITDRKRKRSIIHNDEHKDDRIEENSINKKFRSFNNQIKEDDDDDDDNQESKDSITLNISGDGGTGEESSDGDDSNSVNNCSGKLRYIYI